MTSTSPLEVNNDDGYFNDLSRQATISSESPNESQKTRSSASTKLNNEAPKIKRVACVICRKRKLKCDGCRPSCGTCSRLGHSCAYDEVRRKSGPKRGYVKELEARLGMGFRANDRYRSRLTGFWYKQHKWRHNSRVMPMDVVHRTTLPSLSPHRSSKPCQSWTLSTSLGESPWMAW